MVHYSAVNSQQIPEAVAAANGIDRDGKTAIVMVTLQKPTPNSPLNSVPATATGHARTLMGAREPLTFRRVDSAGSIDLLAPLAIEDNQTLTFELDVSADDGGVDIPVRFNQTFYTE